MSAPRTDYQKLTQAKHVPELPLLRAVAASTGIGAQIWHLEVLPEVKRFPYKVVRAKLQQMINSGLVQGCCCGCRGDFTLGPTGRARLAATSPADAPRGR